jgi:hypothetical protein
MPTDLELAAAVLWSTAGLLAAAAVFLALHVASSRRRVGAELHADRAARWPRWLMRALLIGVAAFVSSLELELPRAPLWAVLALCGTIVVLRPATGDSVYGERGVRRGWLARRFDELEEWRLVGDHLRWKLSGEWLACPVPEPLREPLRAKLVALCPERESRFQ